MVDSVTFVNAVAGAPSYTGRALRQTASVYLPGATAARPLGARSGVRLGTSTTTVSATSTTWTCGPFAGVADVQAAAEAGPYMVAFDAPASGAINAADATYPRSDLIYVQIDDPSEGDGSTVPAVTRKYVAGVAAAAPATPATPARSLAIARINVPVAGGGNPTVTWIAPTIDPPAPTRGIATFSTDTAGLGYITHGLGAVPSVFLITPVYTNDTLNAVWVPSVSQLTSTTAQIVSMRTDTRVRLQTTNVTVHWVAFP